MYCLAVAWARLQLRTGGVTRYQDNSRAGSGHLPAPGRPGAEVVQRASKGDISILNRPSSTETIKLYNEIDGSKITNLQFPFLT